MTPRRAPTGPGPFGPARAGPLPPVPPESDYFLCRVASVLATTPVGYTFIERHLDDTATLVDKTAGRQNTASDPAYAVDGSTFAVNDTALCRRGPGAAGLLWEMVKPGGASNVVSANPCLSDAWLKWVQSSTNWTIYHRGGSGRCSCFQTDDPTDPTVGIIATYISTLSSAPAMTWLGIAPVGTGTTGAMIRTCCGCGSGQLKIDPTAAAGQRAQFVLGGVHVACVHGSGGSGAVFTETLTDYCVGTLPDGRRYILFYGSSDNACSGSLAGCSNEYQILAVCGGPALVPACDCDVCQPCCEGATSFGFYALGLTGFSSDAWNGDWVWTNAGGCTWTAVCEGNTSTLQYIRNSGPDAVWRLTHGGAVYEVPAGSFNCTTGGTLSLVSGTGPATVTVHGPDVTGTCPDKVWPDTIYITVESITLSGGATNPFPVGTPIAATKTPTLPGGWTPNAGWQTADFANAEGGFVHLIYACDDSTDYPGCRGFAVESNGQWFAGIAAGGVGGPGNYSKDTTSCSCTPIAATMTGSFTNAAGVVSGWPTTAHYDWTVGISE